MKKIEKKWQEIWEKENLARFNDKNADKKYYCLEMFSYPSAAKLHLGHWYNYGPTDSFARYKKMKGFEVFQPMGFDAFGLPAENYAIKTGVHPKDSAWGRNSSSFSRSLHDPPSSYRPNVWPLHRHAPTKATGRATCRVSGRHQNRHV